MACLSAIRKNEISQLLRYECLELKGTFFT